MPIYNAQTRRPYYTEEQQQLCLDVRAQHRGVNGQPIMFYTRRRKRAARQPRQGTSMAPTPVYTVANSRTTIREAVRSLGLARVTAVQVESAILELFPAGIAETDPAEVIRAVFLRLARQEKTV